MKKIVITILTGIAFSSTLKGQCDIKMTDIFTPSGSPVITFLMCESSTSTRDFYDIYYSQTYPNAQQIKTYDGYSSTRKFNCHGYAWLRMETGIDRWIGTGWYNLGDILDPQSIYMTDGSYVQVNQEIYPGKVSWRSADHSAITTSQPGVFRSKWNEYPLMEHAKDYSPYGSSDLKYYIRSMSISGPDYLTANAQPYFSFRQTASPVSAD